MSQLGWMRQLGRMRRLGRMSRRPRLKAALLCLFLIVGALL